MDWTFAYVLAGVLLNALVLGFWKPWLGAYGGEKGKNLARKEDLAEILAEVRAVTITQKEIESKLSGELWHRQMLWNQKRDTYAALLKAKEELTDAFGPLPTIIKLSKEATTESMQLSLMEKLNDQLHKVSNAQGSFNSAYTLAVIFASRECLDLLEIYVRRATKATYPPTAEWAEAEFNSALILTALSSLAKKDLGIT